MQQKVKWTKELEAIRDILDIPEFNIAIKWGAEVFTYDGRNVVSYGGFKNYFAIWFFNGVFLNDPYQVLVNASEGKTKSMRQWRFNNLDEIDRPKILDYLYEAIEIEKKGLKIPAEKQVKFVVDGLLKVELENNPQLRLSFDQLKLGRRKEYLEFINAAKQEKTRWSRLEKIKPMILSGIGMNDKYKK
jgi:uncharacterized protein YdeI (YjbR/CyaY-like superfamily)